MESLGLGPFDYAADLFTRRKYQEMLAGALLAAAGQAEQVDVRVEMKRRSLCAFGQLSCPSFAMCRPTAFAEPMKKDDWYKSATLSLIRVCR
jgi:hypothetical protein